MRPTKHMDPSEEEMIAHIRESLVSYEEPYVPGAWEKFNNDREKDRGLIFWLGPLSGAAAVLLITAGMYFFINKSPKKEQVQLTGITKEAIKDHIRKLSEQDTSMAPASNINDPVEKVIVETTKHPDHYIDAANAVVAKKTTLVNDVRSAESLLINNNNVVKTEIPARGDMVVASTGIKTDHTAQPGNKANPENKSTNFQEFLKNEVIAANNKASAAITTHGNKWEVGVVVAPSFGNTKKLNMGYGVSMGYAVSEKISLGSGISYNELTASRNVIDGTQASPGGSSIAADAKNLESVEARVIGIDIPLELKYHFSKSLYANVGISAFAVLNQKQNNNYIQEKLIERSDSPVDGFNDYNSFVVKQKTTEEAPKSEVSQDKYLGFYNFSFGYKQKISKTNSVSIEPFMKIPMKEVSKENLRLVGTGVRLKFDF